jgi:phosphoglucosamine mutase
MAFSELGAEVVLLGCQPNGTNINDHVGALYPEQCALKVKETNADIGFCFDGDADRLTVVDEKGQVVNGDQLMGLLAKFLNDSNDLDGNKEIVGTVMSNFGVEQFLLSQGLTFFRTNVGDRYIVERMQTSGSLFGGEPSGHLVFKKYATTGDGILAALKVVECIQYYQKPLSELISQIVLVPQKLINVKVSHKKDFATIDVLQKALQAYDLKLQGKGRILLRYSGTENLARVMVEGIDKQVVDQICAELADILSKELN